MHLQRGKITGDNQFGDDVAVAGCQIRTLLLEALKPILKNLDYNVAVKIDLSPDPHPYSNESGLAGTMAKEANAYDRSVVQYAAEFAVKCIKADCPTHLVMSLDPETFLASIEVNYLQFIPQVEKILKAFDDAKTPEELKEPLSKLFSGEWRWKSNECEFVPQLKAALDHLNLDPEASKKIIKEIRQDWCRMQYGGIG